jgi:hypothetical protein
MPLHQPLDLRLAHRSFCDSDIFCFCSAVFGRRSFALNFGGFHCGSSYPQQIVSRLSTDPVMTI